MRDKINNHPEIDWAAIEGLRHVLVHDYYQVNLEMIWPISAPVIFFLAYKN